MRDIKFRAWNKNTKKMYKIGQITLEKGTWNYEPDNREYVGMSIPYQPSSMLMQYTGLKDKNGKEIYEGDIVKAVFTDEEESEMKGVVIYAEAGACYMVIANNGDEWDLGYLDKIEKIGNKWDNPELLEEGEEER